MMKSLCAFFALLFLSLPLLAQTSTTGQLTGTVTDPSGAVIAKANITVVNLETGVKRATSTSSQGLFNVPLLDPGLYTVTVSAHGFDTISRERINLNVGRAISLTFQLPVGGEEQRVVVSGEAPLIETSNPNTTVTLNSQQIEDMPNPGNDLTYLATVAPGVVMNTINSGGYNGGNLEVNGLPTSANDYAIDGLNATNPWNSMNQSGATGLMLGANAVQEVTVSTQSFSVDQSRLGSAQMSYTTKSGTNQFHGNAYEIWNGSVLNTTNYFIKASPTTAKKPRSNVNEFGFSVGGPIFRDKLFFFTDFEGMRIVLPGIQTVTVPSSYYQNYVLNQLAVGGTDSVLGGALPAQPAEVPLYRSMFALLPDATTGTPLRVAGCPFDSNGAATSSVNANQGNGCALRRIRTFSNPLSETLWTLRLDHAFSKSDSAWVRYQMDHGASSSPNPVNTLFDVHADTPLKSGSAGWTHIFSPNLVNQLNPGVSYIDRVHGYGDEAAAKAAMPIAFSASPFSTIGISNLPYGDRSISYQLADNLIWNVGRHQMKFGVNLLRSRFTSAQSAGFTTPYVSALSLPQFTYGASGLTYAYFPTYVNDHLGAVNVDFYASDVYRITPKLTASYGLRVTWNSNLRSYDNVISRLSVPFENLSHDLSIPLNQAIKGNQGTLFSSTPLFVYQPRIGLAYEIQPKTVVRASGGVFTSPTTGFLPTYADENAPSMASFQTGISYNRGTAAFPGVPDSTIDAAAAMNQAFQAGFARGALSCASPNSSPSDCIPAVTFYDLESSNQFKVPMHFQWNFGIDRQFGATRVLGVKYVGTRSTQNFFIANPNGYQTACSGCWGSYSYQQAPDPRFGQVFSFKTGANSSYHALQTSFEQRLSHGIDARVNYTWSHCMDSNSNGGVTIFQANTGGYPFDGELKKNWASCDYDVRHSVNASYSYLLPFRSNNHLVRGAIGGWKLSGNIFVRGGFPFSVYSRSPYNILNSSARYNIFANRVSGQDLYAKQNLPDVTTPGTIQWLNPNAFQSVVDPTTGSCYPSNTPVNCQNGTFRRNSARLPGFKWTDLSVSKRFPVHDQIAFRFEAQFYNLFNHPNFGAPTSSTGYTGSPQAGIPSSPATLYGFGVIDNTVGPSTGLLGSPTIGGDSSVRMIAFRGTITF
ncbi:MAG: carboxypeptidase-like regulatory domain-containing protein [Edaphobacter sp.]|uniref:TonB-dependent receptor n=1 Tax=Edaphobacter sp. TaxID=1934404 RepID=UPI0023A43141|nr:carboxypeptidase-like regulatory domain-containing protein [Edaphobacter sp.]MDE1175712.1 carboxypeptidase-like regulatory domain-containing protein [Edaphobacter sp.]